MNFGRALPTAALALLSGILAVTLTFRRYEEAYAWVTHTSDVRLVIGRSIGRVSELDPRGCEELRRDVVELGELTRDNAAQQQRLPTVTRDLDAACAGRGRDALLSSLVAADQEERRLLLARRAKLDAIRGWSLAALIFAMLSALSIVAVAWRIQRRALASARELARQLEEVSVTDELTKLYNRRGFFFVAAPAFALARRQKRDAAVVFTDLDGLKLINDQLGHDEGDRALREFAAVLRSSFRSTDVVARLGGDEFVAFLVDVDPDRLSTIEARLHYALASWNAKASDRLRLQTSLGIARLGPGDNRTMEELVQEADDLMYANKRARRQQPAAS